MAYDYLIEQPHVIIHHLDALQHQIHKDNKKWWTDLDGNNRQQNKGEKLALIHSEISEALEGVRKSLQDKHLPQYNQELVELADAVIRIFDYCEGFQLGPLGPVILNKLLYNRQRQDHTIELRAQEHGKKF